MYNRLPRLNIKELTTCLLLYDKGALQLAIRLCSLVTLTEFMLGCGEGIHYCGTVSDVQVI